MIYIPQRARSCGSEGVDQNKRPKERSSGCTAIKDCTNQGALGVPMMQGMLISFSFFPSPRLPTLRGQALMEWAQSPNTDYYLRGINPPKGRLCRVNLHKNPIKGGTYSIYAARESGATAGDYRVMSGRGPARPDHAPVCQKTRKCGTSRSRQFTPFMAAQGQLAASR